MIDEFITKVGIAIRDFLSGYFNLNWIPETFWWWWWLFVFFVVCVVIINLFGWSKIVKMVTSVAFLFAAVFVAGGQYMAHRLKKKTPVQKPKLAPPSQPPPWRWPWNDRPLG